MPFLSLLDDRAKPKGSRDPLGFELIWTYYGRQVIGNLTTITGSLSNFAVAILGFKWANDIYVHTTESDRQSGIRDAFLRYEQMAAYLRYLSSDTQIMGVTRVQKRIKDNSSKVSFGLGPDSQILSDQASYGLWGLYSSAMRDAGLIQGDNRELTPIGLMIAGKFESDLDKSHFINLFSSSKPMVVEELSSLAPTFKRAIDNNDARKDLMNTLMKGGGSHKDIQQELWSITCEMIREEAYVSGISDYVTQVKARLTDSALNERLTEIESVERVLVAANNIFNYCRRNNGAKFSDVVRELSHYRYEYLSTSLTFEGFRNSLGHPRVDCLQRLLQAFRNHDHSQAVTALLELNRIVMELRGGCPWIELEKGERIRVKVPNETATLKAQAELESHWDYDYFISSYINIASQGLGLLWKTQ